MPKTMRSDPVRPSRWLLPWVTVIHDSLSRRLTNKIQVCPPSATSLMKASRSAISLSSNRPGAPEGNPSRFWRLSKTSIAGLFCR